MIKLRQSCAFGIAVAIALVLFGCGSGERSKRVEVDRERVDLPKIESVEGLEEIWSQDVGGRVGNGHLDLVAASVNGVVYAADPDGEVVAISGEDGEKNWTVDIEDEITAGVGVGDGFAFVADREGRVHAIDAQSGELKWSANAGGEVLAPPVVSTNTVIIRTVAGLVVGLRTSDGERRWAYQRTVPALSLRGTAAPAIYEGVALTSFASGKLVANEIETGTILWEYDVVAPAGRNEIDRMIDLDATPLLIGSVLYLAAFQSEVIALSLGTRKVIWRNDVSSFRDIAADDDSIYVTADDGEVIAFDRLTGEQRWTQPALRGYSETGPTVFGDLLLVGDSEGQLHLLERNSGEFVGRLDIGNGFVGSVLHDGDRIYAMSRKGRLSAYPRPPTG